MLEALLRFTQKGLLSDWYRVVGPGCTVRESCTRLKQISFRGNAESNHEGVARSAPLRAGIENHEGEAENEWEYLIERIPRDD
jgi:hypothetical protein